MTKARTLGGVRCDPGTAQKVAATDGATLYRTKSKKFFLCVHVPGSNDTLVLLTRDQAAQWIEQNSLHVNAAAVLEPAPAFHLTVDLPPGLVNRIDKARGKRSRKSVIQAALEQFFTE